MANGSVAQQTPSADPEAPSAEHIKACQRLKEMLPGRVAQETEQLAKWKAEYAALDAEGKAQWAKSLLREIMKEQEITSIFSQLGTSKIVVLMATYKNTRDMLWLLEIRPDLTDSAGEALSPEGVAIITKSRDEALAQLEDLAAEA